MNDFVLIQVPQCVFRVIDFQASASSGQFVCQWAREWELACHFELSAFNTSFKLSGKEVEQWFEKRTGKSIINDKLKYKVSITSQNISVTNFTENFLKYMFHMY